MMEELIILVDLAHDLYAMDIKKISRPVGLVEEDTSSQRLRHRVPKGVNLEKKTSLFQDLMKEVCVTNIQIELSVFNQ